MPGFFWQALYFYDQRIHDYTIPMLNDYCGAMAYLVGAGPVGGPGRASALSRSRHICSGTLEVLIIMSVECNGGDTLVISELIPDSSLQLARTCTMCAPCIAVS
jgi:hypothetical protein